MAIHQTVMAASNNNTAVHFVFKRFYALRTECERYNFRFKGTRQERLWVRNGKSTENLNTIAHIPAPAVTKAAVIHGSRHSYRSLKHLRATAV